MSNPNAETVNVTVRFRSGELDVELGTHQHAEGHRVATYLAASTGGRVVEENVDGAVSVIAIIPPQHQDDPHALTVQRMRYIAALRNTLATLTPDTPLYRSLRRDLFYCEPVAHRPPPLPPREPAEDTTSAAAHSEQTAGVETSAA